VGARAHVIAFAEIGGAGPVNTDAGGIERLDVVNMSGPQREVFVDDLTGTGVQVVHLLHVAGPAPAQDFVSGTLGDDRIRIRGTATGVSVGQLAASVAIDGAARLTVRGGDGNDVIDATGLAAGVVTLTEKGGEFPVASPRSAFDGNDTLVGTPGDDFLFGGTGVNSYDGRGGNDTIVDQ
jgi:Ca2+-binding RTX toxin-like protein